MTNVTEMVNVETLLRRMLFSIKTKKGSITNKIGANEFKWFTPAEGSLIPGFTRAIFFKAVFLKRGKKNDQIELSIYVDGVKKKFFISLKLSWEKEASIYELHQWFQAFQCFAQEVEKIEMSGSNLSYLLSLG